MTEPVETAEPVSAGPTYEFDAAFQQKVVALMLRDAGFLRRTVGLVKPDYLENDADRAIAKVALDYFETYKKTPDFKLVPTLLKAAIVGKKLRADLVEPIKERIREINKTDLSDREFVIDEVAAFARHQAMTAAIMDSVGALEKGDFGKIEKLVRQAMIVGANEGSEDYDYFSGIDSRTTKRIDMLAGVIKPDGITTGVPELDKLLYHGGWGRKELSVIMGAAKAGKSTSLGEFGKNASLAGYNVLYVTLEVSRDIIADRLDANLSDIAIRVIKDNPHAVKAKIAAAAAKAGVFKIREYASNTFKASQLRRLLEDYRANSVVFDLVIVDYADIMVAERFSGEPREDLRTIYLDLRAIAFDYNCALLTATQTNREGAKAAVAKMTDVAEDFNKIRTADIVISINAVEEERKSGEARLYFAAARNGETGLTVRIKQDRERMQFIKKVLSVER